MADFDKRREPRRIAGGRPLLNHGWLALTMILAVTAPATSAATAFEDDGEDPKQLTRLSLEELADLKVVTVSRRVEGNLETPAAVHVITSEDIRRTGSSSIPDALRMSPGLQASRIDADEWALAIRGFASRLSRSVLTVVDGRSIWNPLFAGIFWDTQDTMLEDIDQMEVSRGPGGAAYGANAINGVISITTKNAKDTQGGLLSLGLGSAEREAGLRYGGAFGETVHYRAFGKYALRDGTKPLTSAGYDDEWKLGLGGFRLDWNRSTQSAFTLIGNLYDGSSPQPITIATFSPPYSTALTGDAAFRGHNLTGRWSKSLSNGGALTAQTYYDRTSRHEPYYGEVRDTVDFDVQHRLQWGAQHAFIWGANYRRSSGTFKGGPTIRMVPDRRSDDMAGVFANGEIRLGTHLRLSGGAKTEWNDYSGWNIQPSGRAALVVSEHLFWGSWTRALRTSSRVEQGILYYTSLSSVAPVFARASGSPDFDPERVEAFEGGYRLRRARALITASAFHNAYYDLATNVVGSPVLEGGTGGEPIRSVIPVLITNGSGGRASGFEGKVVFSPAKMWRLQGAYSLLKLGLNGDAGKTFKSNSPRHQFWLSSYLTPMDKLDIDLVFRAVGSIPGHAIPSFTDLDARIGWRVRSSIELSLTGSNLFQPSRPEFGGGFAIERAVRVQSTVRF